VIVIKAGNTGGRRYEVFMGRELVNKATAVWALWNGGPGIVAYLPTTIDGLVYLDDSGTHAATAYRVGRVLVREVA
jgi:hypothetical protein